MNRIKQTLTIFKINRLNKVNKFNFSEKVFQKINITRLPQEKYSVYIDTNDTCETLFNHLNKLFPKANFISINSYENKLGQ